MIDLKFNRQAIKEQREYIILYFLIFIFLLDIRRAMTNSVYSPPPSLIEQMPSIILKWLHYIIHFLQRNSIQEINYGNMQLYSPLIICCLILLYVVVGKKIEKKYNIFLCRKQTRGCELL